MTTIEINEMTKQEQDALLFNRHPEFKMIDENTGMIGNYAIIKFDDSDREDPVSKKTRATDLCENYTHEEIIPALALMAYRQDNHFGRLPKYIAEFEELRQSGKPMSFYPFATNEKELRGCLKDEILDQDVDEYLKKHGDDYFYSPIGALLPLGTCA